MSDAQHPIPPSTEPLPASYVEVTGRILDILRAHIAVEDWPRILEAVFILGDPTYDDRTPIQKSLAAIGDYLRENPSIPLGILAQLLGQIGNPIYVSPEAPMPQAQPREPGVDDFAPQDHG